MGRMEGRVQGSGFRTREVGEKDSRVHSGGRTDRLGARWRFDLLGDCAMMMRWRSGLRLLALAKSCGTCSRTARILAVRRRILPAAPRSSVAAAPMYLWS